MAYEKEVKWLQFWFKVLNQEEVEEIARKDKKILRLELN